MKTRMLALFLACLSVGGCAVYESPQPVLLRSGQHINYYHERLPNMTVPGPYPGSVCGPPHFLHDTWYWDCYRP